MIPLSAGNGLLWWATWLLAFSPVLIVGIILGATWLLDYASGIIDARRPRCHGCRMILRRIREIPLGSPPIPKGAVWYCPRCQPRLYYTRPDRSPEPLE